MKLLVLGAAVSGRAAAYLGRRLGHDVAVYDRESTAVAQLRDEGFVLHSGAWTERLLRNVDLVVTSPGIPEHAEPIQATLQRNVRVVSEMEFAASALSAPYVAVTGTNGKTTVTETAAAMLVASGVKACAAGNIGTALSSVVDEPWDVVVIEASSFQLRFVDRFHPAAAAVLNVAPDHLDWHGTFDAYLAAKARIHERQGEGDLLVYEADDAGARRAVAAANSRLLPVSGRRVPDEGFGVAGDSFVLGDLRVPAGDIGAAFRSDLAAAAALALHVGATEDGVAEAIEQFAPGAHRRTTIGTWDGVTWVDDSKATNPHAALASAADFPSVILIAGGRNKGLDLAPMVRASTVRRVVALGEAATELTVVDPARVVTVRDLGDAVATADGMARPGDTVLLAPGCASFDMFDSYAHRGDEFTRLVRERKEPR